MPASGSNGASSARSARSSTWVKEFLGDDLFMQLATVRLGDIDDYLTPLQKAEVIEEGRIARKYKIAARA